MLSEKERQALDGITFHVTDDGGVDYRREDGNLLTLENSGAREIPFAHECNRAVDRCIGRL